MAKNVLDKFLEMDRYNQKRFIQIITSMQNDIEEKKEIKKYDEKIINGLECFVLDYDDETKEITYTTKNILSAEDIKKYFTDKWYLADWNDRYIRYSAIIKNNRFEDSYIYSILNNQFKYDKLKNLNLVGDIRLLTKEEVESLDDEHKNINSSYWTMTPYENMDNLEFGEYAHVFYVHSSGYLNSTNVIYTAIGVRPVFTLKTE